MRPSGKSVEIACICAVSALWVDTEPLKINQRAWSRFLYQRKQINAGNTALNNNNNGNNLNQANQIKAK